jgi:hypothetical protein
MTATTVQSAPALRDLWQHLWRRQLDRYPDTRQVQQELAGLNPEPAA